jgi:thiol-disulfide isomerase/thioredoxin
VLSGLLAGSARGLSFVDPDGEAVEVAAPSGSAAVVVHFWATWCPDCVSELGRLARAASACRGTAVRVVAVDVGEDVRTVRAYLAKHPIDLPVLRDPHGAVWRDEAGAGLPANLVWTPSARRSDVGPRSADAWRRELAGLGCRDPVSGAGPAP